MRKLILKSSDSELIKTLCEICQNTVCGNVKISKKYVNQLKKFKKVLRKIVVPKLSLKTKRNILIQKGGFLPIILTALLSSIIGRIIQ